MASRDKDAAKEASGRESRTTANIVRVGLAAAGAAIVVVAIVLAIRTPSVSTKTSTYNGAAGRGAVPTKVVVTNARPSDTVLAALLALGGVLIVAGAVYPRLSTLKGPGFEVGLAELSPDAKEELTKKAREEAEARGVPSQADAVAEEAEKALLDRLYIPSYGLTSSRSPYRTTYGLGLPMAVQSVTSSDIADAVSAAIEEVAQTESDEDAPER